MASDIQTDAPPLTPFIKTATNGAHYLAGSRCKACGQLFVGERRVCARCFARDEMEAVKLADTGKVYAFTIVERSFPGVKTPFVAVTVDLDDGSHLKGTLEGVEPTPQAIKFDMPVRLGYRVAVPVNSPGSLT
jgi:uncharacterized OB-fold protein